MVYTLIKGNKKKCMIIIIGDYLCFQQVWGIPFGNKQVVPKTEKFSFLSHECNIFSSYLWNGWGNHYY